jgi:hypothetical protein
VNLKENEVPHTDWVTDTWMRPFNPCIRGKIRVEPMAADYFQISPYEWAMIGSIGLFISSHPWLTGNTFAQNPRRDKYPQGTGRRASKLRPINRA